MDNQIIAYVIGQVKAINDKSFTGKDGKKVEIKQLVIVTEVDNIPYVTILNKPRDMEINVDDELELPVLATVSPNGYLLKKILEIPN